jgi:methylated-DNA-protein-cysteine methyltransferase related protein
LSPLRERICEVTCRIPRGSVATYGDVARMAGSPRSAREVGRTMASLPEGSDVPWWRVINRRGEIVLRADGMEEQAARLAAEGIDCGAGGRIDLDRYRWEGSDPSFEP